VTGLLRTFYAFAEDEPVLAGETLSGFFLDRAQFAIEGQVEDYAFRFQLEGAGGSLVPLDMYGTWLVNEQLRVTMGNMRSPFMWESLLDDSDLLYLQRTDSGELFYSRQPGAMINGNISFVRWMAACQNGFDSVGDRQAYTGRLTLDVLGGGVGWKQGAYGGDDEMHLSVSGALFDDNGVPKDGEVWTADAQFEIGAFAADAQWIDYPDDGLPDIGPPPTSIFPNHENAQSIAASVSWVFVPDKYEVGVRYEATGNQLTDPITSISHDDKDRAWTLGVNRYIAGHDVKWLFNVVHVDSGDPAKDNTLRFGLGLNIRI
jgi:hypothetical protein